MLLVKFNNVDELPKSLKENIIGYYVSKDRITLWLDEREIDTPVISINDIVDIYDECVKKNINCYKNPPLDLWLNEHREFIRALSSNLANKYNREKDDTLSDIYYIICLLYKNNKYLGSLNYIRKSCENYIKLLYKRDKFNKLISSGMMISLDTPLSVDDDISLSEIIEDTSYNNDNCFDEVIKLLRISLLSIGMSNNEIMLILDNKYDSLTSSRYRQFLKWRKNHNIYEFLSDKE